ncbi:MAG: trypsin-like peptidase domain-containing protein [Candidatus Zixiibacteriota bacterium]
MKAMNKVLLLWPILCAFLFSGTEGSYAQQKVLSSLENDITSLVESIKPSLVTIETESPGFKKEKKESAPPTFVGSGIIYTSDGYILTTAGVVGERQSFKVTLPNRKSLKGKLVGTDDQANLAVLKVDVTGLSPAKLGDSDKVKVGSWLTVVGNSYGLPNAVALGLVNGLREDGFIQMSANVSPGNSGGPVLDTYGNVIGLVSAKLSEPSYISSIKIFEKAMNKTITIPSREIETPSSGVSLALPVNRVKAIAEEIIKHGSVKRGYLGVYLQDIDQNQLKEREVGGGVLVSGVVEGSPAQKAGLVDGDLIVEFGGTKVRSADQIRHLIENKGVGDRVALKIIRDGEPDGIAVTLGEARPAFSYYFSGPDALEAPAPNAGPEFIQEVNEMQAGQQQVEGERQMLDQLRDQLTKLEQEMKRLNQELEKLKLERSGK